MALNFSAALGYSAEIQGRFQKAEEHRLLKNIKYLEQLCAVWDGGEVLLGLLFK